MSMKVQHWWDEEEDCEKMNKQTTSPPAMPDQKRISLNTYTNERMEQG